MKFMQEYYPYSESMCVEDIPEDAMEPEQIESLLWLRDYHKQRYEAAKDEMFPELYAIVLGGETTQKAELGCTLDYYNMACTGESKEDIIKYTKEWIEDILDNFLIIPVVYDGTDRPYREFLRQFNNYLRKE